MKNELKKILLNYKIGTVRLNAKFLNNFILSKIPNKKKNYTLLDIGCGADSLVRYNNNIYKVGFDGNKKVLQRAQNLRTHDEYLMGDFSQIDKIFLHKKFDFIIAIDFIEHLKKEDGLNLLKFMEKKAKVGCLIFTPNGFLYQPSVIKGDLMEHLSGWEANDFLKKGYKVYGGTGFKFIRKEFYEIKFRPKFLWAVLSYFSQIFFTKYFHKHAAAIWAIKDFR
jgi:hypothetical protein